MGIGTGLEVGVGVGETMVSAELEAFSERVVEGDETGDPKSVDGGVGDGANPVSKPLRRAMASQSNLPVLKPLSSLTINPYAVFWTTYRKSRTTTPITIIIKRRRE